MVILGRDAYAQSSLTGIYKVNSLQVLAWRLNMNIFLCHFWLLDESML